MEHTPGEAVQGLSTGRWNVGEEQVDPELVPPQQVVGVAQEEEEHTDGQPGMEAQVDEEVDGKLLLSLIHI